jgi:hypothetical protein
MSDTIRHYRPLLSDIYGHLKPTIVLTQNLVALTISLIVQLTVKIKLIRMQYTELQQI